MTGFKLYEDGSRQLKSILLDMEGVDEAVEEEGEEEGDEGVEEPADGPAMTLMDAPPPNQPLTLDDVHLDEETARTLFGGLNHKAGRYAVFRNDAASKDISLLLPGCGPWYALNTRVTGAVRLLWFHIPWHRLGDFYRILGEIITAKTHYLAAENMWIEAGLAIVSVLNYFFVSYLQTFCSRSFHAMPTSGSYSSNGIPSWPLLRRRSNWSSAGSQPSGQATLSEIWCTHPRFRASLSYTSSTLAPWNTTRPSTLLRSSTSSSSTSLLPWRTSPGGV